MLKQIATLALFLTIGLGVGVGSKYLYSWFSTQPAVEQGDFTQFHQINNSPKVILYGTSWCNFCKLTRELLAEHKVAYIDLDIEKSEIGKQQYQSIKGRGVPLLLIGNTRINGFNPAEILATIEDQKLTSG